MLYTLQIHTSQSNVFTGHYRVEIIIYEKLVCLVRMIIQAIQCEFL